jgi:hypothetical protein
MDEGRKRVLLIAASILAARNLAKWIFLAEKLLKRIDALWPSEPKRVH